MKILYDKTGKIHYAIPDYKYFYFKHSTNIPLTEMSLSEILGNKNLCFELYYKHSKVDDKGDHKYFIKNGLIEEKPNWKEYEEYDVKRIRQR